jgi:hypothetical protein
MLALKPVLPESPPGPPGSVQPDRSTAMPDWGSAREIRVAAPWSLPPVKQCANSA